MNGTIWAIDSPTDSARQNHVLQTTWESQGTSEQLYGCMYHVTRSNPQNVTFAVVDDKQCQIPGPT